MIKFEDIDWSSVDWSRKRKDIAYDLGIHPSRLSRYSKRLGIKPLTTGNLGRGLGPLPAAVWENVDWQKRNIDIARELGVGAGTVSQRRQMAGAARLRKSSLLSMLDVGGGAIGELLQSMRPGASLYFPEELKGTLYSAITRCGLARTLKLSTWNAKEAHFPQREAKIMRIEYPES